MSRNVREYCHHCRSEQWCTFKGKALYCPKDHFVRSKKAARTAPAVENMYNLVRSEINSTFRNRGLYNWDELINWCRRAHFDDLKSFCEDMKELS